MFAVWAQGSLMYIFFIFIFVLEISCQHLGNTCQLNLYTGIGYILPTISGYMSVWRVSSAGPNCPLFQVGQLGPGQLGPGAETLQLTYIPQ